jgi:hypothetical protein
VVIVDGTDAGVLPYAGRIAPGDHEIKVRLAGYVTERRMVRVSREPQAQVRIEVHLARGLEPTAASRVRATSSAARQRPPRRPPRTTRPVVGPLVLGIVGAAGVGLAVGALVAGDCETESVSGKCLVGDVTNEVAAIGYGLAGLGALTAALLWRVLGGKAESSAPTISVGPSFVLVRGDL